MASDAPMEIASAIQSASINRHASVRHDLNPSTAASKKEPVTLSSSPAQSDVAEDEIPLSALHPVPRRNTMPPLPDLRFEQSYLKSIESATSWQSILWITFRDQVALAFIQGAVWTLVLSGWRHWNRSSQFSGRSVGSRIRRWWWGVNNWTVPEGKGLRNQGPAKDVQGVRRSFMKYYQGEFSSAAQD